MSDTNAVAPVETTAGTIKRAIQMGYFRNDQAKAAVMLKQSTTLGQIIGTIYTVKEKIGEVNGDVTRSLLAIGEFEAVIYATGEVMESASAYLPNYFLEAIKATLDAGGASYGITFAVEVVMVPTGKSIPFAYEVRNLAQKVAESPLQAMKRQLQAAGALKVSAPVALTADAATALIGTAPLPINQGEVVAEDAMGDTGVETTPAKKTPAKR